MNGQPDDGTVWKGSRELQLQKPRWKFTANGVSLTLVWEGPIDTCHEERPGNGQPVEGFNRYGLRVTEAEIEELDGGAGRLTVQLSSPSAEDDQGDDVGFEPVGDPVYELDWVEVTAPIELSESCGTLNPERKRYDENGKEIPPVTGEPPKGRQRTWDDWPEMTEDDYESNGGWSLDDYKSLKNKGVESYTYYQPVVRRTLYYLRDPGGVGGNLNRRQMPPAGSSAPSGYQWIVAKANLQREGRYRTVVEEWRGAEKWDPLLYPTG